MKPLICIVGCSGVGKDYLSYSFCLNRIPSYTTRKIRINEVPGVSHVYVDENFYNEFDKNNIAAWTLFAGNYYWTSIDQLEDLQYDVYIIDPEGVYNLISIYNQGKIKRNIKIVYVKTNIIKRIYNMFNRGDSIKQIFKRLINDRKPFNKFEKEFKGKYFLVKV